MSTIHELARELNVSISTVSRALSGKPNVNEATRLRVLEAARRRNYAPNRSGRSLRSGATDAITFMLSPHPQLLYSEPFFMPLLGGVQEALAARGLELAVALGRPGAAQVDQLRDIAGSRSSDGVLLAWTRQEDERLSYLARSGLPFAALGRSRSGGAFPSLDIDFEDLGSRAVERLAGFGHRRIALVNTAPELMFHAFLLAGFRRGLLRRGLPADPALERADPMSESAGYALVRDLMDLPDPPTALLVCGETMLASAWRALADCGRRPGREVAVIAVTDSPLCGCLQPAITSFRPPLPELGRRLVEILLAAMPAFAGPEGPRARQEVWRLELVERASDGPLRL